MDHVITDEGDLEELLAQLYDCSWKGAKTLADCSLKMRS
jgi:hypothetical protein